MSFDCYFLMNRHSIKPNDSSYFFTASNYFLIVELMYFFLSFCFSALDKIIVQGYKALQLEYFFTAGPDEVKAWTIQVRKCEKYSTLIVMGVGVGMGWW